MRTPTAGGIIPAERKRENEEIRIRSNFTKREKEVRHIVRHERRSGTGSARVAENLRRQSSV